MSISSYTEIETIICQGMKIVDRSLDGLFYTTKGQIMLLREDLHSCFPVSSSPVVQLLAAIIIAFYLVLDSFKETACINYSQCITVDQVFLTSSNSFLRF